MNILDFSETSFGYYIHLVRPTVQMFPGDFLERLKDIVPDKKHESVLAAMSSPKATGFRVNTLKGDQDEVISSLLESNLELHEVEWNTHAFWVDSDQRAQLLTSAPYLDQKIYIQNLSSMLPPLVLEPQPGDKILDLTAAPGSKTLQIACIVEQDAEIAAVEVVKSRFFKLRDNLESQGATEVRTFLKDGRSVWKNRPEYFDRVLLDAPCSSEGRFHRSDPETYAYWSLRKVKEMARKQKRLIYSAVQCLKPGGTLVYSTCSFSPEENEAIVAGILRRFPEALHVEPIALDVNNLEAGLDSWKGKPFNPDISLARRVYPSYQMDGFFICKMRKTSSTLPK